MSTSEGLPPLQPVPQNNGAEVFTGVPEVSPDHPALAANLGHTVLDGSGLVSTPDVSLPPTPPIAPSRTHASGPRKIGVGERVSDIVEATKVQTMRAADGVVGPYTNRVGERVGGTVAPRRTEAYSEPDPSVFNNPRVSITDRRRAAFEVGSIVHSGPRQPIEKYIPPAREHKPVRFRDRRHAMFVSDLDGSRLKFEARNQNLLDVWMRLDGLGKPRVVQPEHGASGSISITYGNLTKTIPWDGGPQKDALLELRKRMFLDPAWIDSVDRTRLGRRRAIKAVKEYKKNVARINNRRSFADASGHSVEDRLEADTFPRGKHEMRDQSDA